MNKLIFVWVGMFICLQTINAQTIQHIYDNSGRLIEVSYPSIKQKVIYTYDKDGNRISELVSIVINDSLLVQPNNLQFANTGGSKTVTVKSNRSWTVSSNESWATVSKVSGNKDDSVIITTSTNPNPTIRSATVTFTAGSITQKVLIIQDSTLVDSLSLDKDTVNVVYAGNTDIVYVTSNRSWTVQSNQPWATVNKSSGNKNDNVVITTSSNPNSTTRTAIVTFTAGTLTRTVTVNQDKMLTPSDILTIDKNVINVPYTGNTDIVSVTSNRSWIVQSDQSWATIFPISGNGNGSFSINTIFNGTGVTRDALITVTAGSKNATVHVLQATQPQTGISDIENTSRVTIFPNPANDVLYIVSENHLQEGFYDLVDINGRVILSGKLPENILTNTLSLNALNGVYTLTLTIGSTVIREKIVVMR